MGLSEEAKNAIKARSPRAEALVLRDKLIDLHAKNDKLQAELDKLSMEHLEIQQFTERNLSKQIDQLEAENEKLKEVFNILRPYHGKTNTKGRMEAIKSSIEFIEKKFVKHDNEASSDCTRCHVVSLARWMSEMVQALNPLGDKT